jgi:hypothetical protein
MASDAAKAALGDACDGQDSKWQCAGPVERRYLAAGFDDDDEDTDDEDAIPGTP